MSGKPTKWARTGDCRVAPWLFGLMRAEFMERRDFIDEYGEASTFQTRWVSAGKFPWQMDITSPYGFWSTMATPIGDTKHYGDRALWRGFITYFKGNKENCDHAVEISQAAPVHGGGGSQPEVRQEGGHSGQSRQGIRRGGQG